MQREVADFLVCLKRDFSELRFLEGRRFMYRPARTIYYENMGFLEGVGVDLELSQKLIQEYKLQVLHEVGHALSEHKFFRTDLQRVKMEREAWERARGLCEQYGVVYNEEFVEEKMDTYREWLHRKSRCPECGLTRYQTKDGRYHCPGCE